MDQPLYDYTLGLADDALVSAQRMGWWISRAPELEEDVALANIGLDQLGQARMLLTYAGEVEGAGRSEDDLAYLRDDRDFRNVKLVERPMTDFGVAMARLLVLATYQSHLYAGLRAAPTRPSPASRRRRSRRSPTTSTTPPSGCCASGTAPTSPTPGCRRRSTPSGPTSPSSSTRSLRRSSAASSPRPTCASAVLSDLSRVVAQATLTVPEVPPALGGGRQGLHTEHLGHLLAEMQHLHRSHPGATW